MIVGSAEVVIVPNTAGFAAALEAETKAPFGRIGSDAEKAGQDAGAGLRTGMRKETGKLAGDLEQAGTAAGAGLRSGVGKETGKLGDDLERDGRKGGEGLTKGLGGGLSKLSTLVENTGLPLGGLSKGLDKAGQAADSASSKSGGLMGTLDKLGGVALIGVAAGFAGAAAEGLHLATGMQTADAQIAAVSGTSVASAKKIGDAFLGTMGSTEFSGLAMAQAFGQVAGQLKATEGHALSTASASKFMAAASDLATAKQIDLGTATTSVAGIMQAYGLKVKDAAHVSDVLFSASNATGLGVDTLSSQLEKMRSKLGDMSGSLGNVSGLLVDMTDHGITGRAALTGLTSGMASLDKGSAAVAKAQTDQKQAFQALSPATQALVKGYADGTVSVTQYAQKVQALNPVQQQQLATYATTTTAVATAKSAVAALGVTVFNSQGQFVGMGSIIDQLGPKFAGMTEQQQLAAATTIFGASAARQMVAVVDAGPAAFDAATASVNKMGAAHAAAAVQAKTLHVEFETLKASAVDVLDRLRAGARASRAARRRGVRVDDAVRAESQGCADRTGDGGRRPAHDRYRRVHGEQDGGVCVDISRTRPGMYSDFVSKLTGSMDTATAQVGRLPTATTTAMSDTKTALASAEAPISTQSAALADTMDTIPVGVAPATTVAMADTELALANADAGIASKSAVLAGEIDTIPAGLPGSTAKALAGAESEMVAAEPVLAADGTADGAAFGGAFKTALGPAIAAVAALIAAEPEINKLTGGGLSADAPPANTAAQRAVDKKMQAQGLVYLNGTWVPQSAAAAAGQTTSAAGQTAALNAGANPTVLQYAGLAAAAGAKYGINPAVILAQIQEESGGTPVHNSGPTPGIGNLTQFEPGTAKEYGVQYGTSAADIQSQVYGEAAYLKALGGQTNIRGALAGYLTGTPGNYGGTDSNGTSGGGYADTILASAQKYAPAFATPGIGTVITGATGATASGTAVGAAGATQSPALALTGWAARRPQPVAYRPPPFRRARSSRRPSLPRRRAWPPLRPRPRRPPRLSPRRRPRQPSRWRPRRRRPPISRSRPPSKHRPWSKRRLRRPPPAR